MAQNAIYTFPLSKRNSDHIFSSPLRRVPTCFCF